MDKRYTTEKEYTGNTRVDFYEDGEYLDGKIVSDWMLPGYLEAKKEDGWVEGYTAGQIEEMEKHIAALKEEIEWRTKDLENMKNNRIKC